MKRNKRGDNCGQGMDNEKVKRRMENGRGGKGRWRVFCGRIDITERSTKLNPDNSVPVEARNEIIFSFAAKGRALVTIFTE